jgi:hypothetical protein
LKKKHIMICLKEIILMLWLFNSIVIRDEALGPLELEARKWTK